MTDIEYLTKYLDKDKLSSGLERLKNGEPVQYIVGNVDFYGLNFNVIAILPLPVPISNISTFLLKYLFIYFIVLLTNSSVSNLGIKVFLFTFNIYP